MHERMCGTTFIYPGKTLEAGMEFARKFDFHAVDVGIGGINGHMLPTDAARDPIRVAHQVKKAADQHGLELHECFSLNFGPPINDPDPLVQQRTKELFGGLCRFAREAGFEGVMLIPGPVHPQIGQKRSLELAADAFADLLPIAVEHRLRLDVEADCASCAHTPDAAEELCQRVPGLHLALDYSHFIYHGFRHEQIERLDRYAGHVHIRQASTHRIVEDVDAGALDLPRLIQHLRQTDYCGRFCVEYLSCQEADECGVDVARETERMVDELSGCLQASG